MTSRELVRASMQGNVAQPSKSHMSKTNNKLVSEGKCRTCKCVMLDCWQTNLVVQEQSLAGLTLLMLMLMSASRWCAPLQAEGSASWTANRMLQSTGPILRRSCRW